MDMASDRFYSESSRLLTSDEFASLFDGEFQRAVRSKSFLTLVLVEARREQKTLEATTDDAVTKVAAVVGREVRDTDLMGKTADGTLSLVLLDADFNSSTRVIDRLVSRIGSADFPVPLQISVGAACYPTHATDVDALKQEALSHPVVKWRGGHREHFLP